MRFRRALGIGTALAIAAALASFFAWQSVGGASASAAGKGGGVVISKGAPVTPASFSGDVRDLAKPSTIPPVPILEPGEPTDHISKQGPPAPAIPAPTASMPASTSFAGLDFNTWGAGHPPDTVGDVGRSFYVQAVNTSVGIWDKTGVSQAAFTFNTLWLGAASGTPCDTANQGDPTVVYDPLADRYIVADFSWSNIKDGPYYECIAVSKTSNPVTGGWWLYGVRADDAAHPYLPDYPKMGIWPDGLYMSANMFDCLTAGCGSATYQEVRTYAFNRTDLESGAVLRSRVADLGSTAQFSLLPSNLRGTQPPAGRENLFVSESESVFKFEVWKFHVDYSGAGSTFTGPTLVSQTAYTVADLTAPSSGNALDTLGDRMMMQNQYRNLGGTESLWVNHTVKSGAGAVNGIQWAQLGVTGGTVAAAPVQQQIYANVASDGLHRFMGSLAVDRQGNMALGYTTSKTAVNPDIRYSGRLVGDALNSLPQGEATMQTGGGSQTGNCGPSTCTRWGDYSAMSVDPVDDCTFWYTNMYYATSGLNWQTRIGSFKFPSCAPAGLSADIGVTKTGPSRVLSGSNAVYTVTVGNAGPSATDVTLDDLTPAGATFVSVAQTSGPTFTCTGAGNVHCTIGTFAVGATAVFKITLTVHAKIKNTATVSTSGSDPNPSNNSASKTTRLR